MDSELHTLNEQLCRQELGGNPLPSFHYAQSQDLPFTLALDIEVFSNYILWDLVRILQLERWVHPKPHFIGSSCSNLVLSQCRVPLKVGQYEDELLYNVVDVKSFDVLLVGFVDCKPCFSLVHGSIICLY